MFEIKVKEIKKCSDEKLKKTLQKKIRNSLRKKKEHMKIQFHSKNGINLNSPLSWCLQSNAILKERK